VDGLVSGVFDDALCDKCMSVFQLSGNDGAQGGISAYWLVFWLPSAQTIPVNLQEVRSVINQVQGEINTQQLLRQTLGDLPALSRQFMLSWSDKILSS